MKRRMLGIVGLLIVAVLLTAAVNVQAAASLAPPADIDDLPVKGWEITKYICDFEGCDPESPNPALWPIHFRLAVDGWAVKVECKQFYTPLPPLHTKCERDGDIFTCNSPPGTQNLFEFVRIIEKPPPKPTPTPSITPTPTNTPTPTPTPTPVPECQVLNDPVYDKENNQVTLSGQGTPGWSFEIWRDYKGEQVLIAQGTVGEDESFGGADEGPPPGLVFYFATVGGNSSEACRKSIELPAPTDFEATMVCTNPWGLGINGRVVDQWEDTYPKPVPMLFKLVSRDEVKNLTVSGTFEMGFDNVRQYIGQEGNEIEIALTMEGYKAKTFDITQAMFDPCPLPTPTPEPTDTPIPTETPKPGAGWDPFAKAVVGTPVPAIKSVGASVTTRSSGGFPWGFLVVLVPAAYCGTRYFVRRRSR